MPEDEKIMNYLADWIEVYHKTGISNPKKILCTLLSHKNKRPFNVYFFDAPALLESDVDYLKLALQRLLKHEPITKIIELSSFYGHSFFINQYVLDPRCDSECLINRCVMHLTKDKGYHFLDLGTGSGCLIITLLLEYPYAKGVAVDCSINALEIARKNAEYHGVLDRLTLIKSNWYEHLPQEMKFSFDLIISNPPYIKEDFQLEESVLNYDPHQALFSGPEGLDDYRKILQNLSTYLKKSGIFFGEIGFDQSESIQSLVKTIPSLRFDGFYKDSSNINRVVKISQQG